MDMDQPKKICMISDHPHNEKLNHFYSNKMHEHHILANRAMCWSFNEIEADAGKRKTASLHLVMILGGAGPPTRPSPQALSMSME